LLNTVGKFFERVIKRRLEIHLSSTNGLSENQYGFRSGKSTIDAISKAMETVEKASSGPLRRRQLCVLVALDVANAFNSANWGIINRAIESKGVPEYLKRIIQSYLHNRKLTYGEDKSWKVTCGVPKGSVLGPTMWNIMYDELLHMDLDTNIIGLPGNTYVSLIAFVDDVALIVTGTTTETLEGKTNEALGKISA